MSLTKVSFSMIDGAQVNAIDFGALGDGSGDLVGSAATGAAWNVWPSWINDANYLTKPGHDYSPAVRANPPFSSSDTWDFVGIQLALWSVQTAGGGTVNLTGTNYIINRTLRFVMPANGIGVNLVGSHYQNCKIQPLTTFNAPISGVGNPLLYFYRVGLSGMTVKNVGISTFPLNGGIPSVVTDSSIVGPNWESNGTYKACVVFNNSDTVTLDTIFMSGYGEAAVVGINACSININNVVTEYQSIAVILRGNSNAFMNNNIIFSSSGTGLNSWQTSGIYLNSSQVYIEGGQITFMRLWALFSDGPNNTFTMNNIVILTENYGQLFRALGLIKWKISNCIMRYGDSMTSTPIVLLDNQDVGSGDVLNPNGTGLFTGNTITNTGPSTLDILRVNGYNIAICNNDFGADATGASTGTFVIDSLINGIYGNPGTVNCIFTGNTLRYATMDQVSIFGMKANNIDSIGASVLTGSATYDPPSLNDGTGTTTTVVVTNAVLGDYVDSVSFSNDLQGITVTGWVSSSNTVSVRFQNESGGVLDLASGTIRVVVQRFNCV